jgi:hypothetical protein
MRLYWAGIERSERFLAKISGATINDGCSLEGFYKVGEHFNLKVLHKDESTLDDLALYLSHDIPPIVDIYSRDDGHYAVVTRITSHHVWYADPEKGRVLKRPIDVFHRLWFDFRGQFPKSKDDFIMRRMIIMAFESTLPREEE